MGLLDGLLGNASEVEPHLAEERFAPMLLDGENVQKAYQLIRDILLFTDRRMVMVDRQGLTGSKVEVHSIPYPSIVRFSVESAGSFDLDAELKVWVRGRAEPIQWRFTKKLNVYDVQRTLAEHVL